MKQGCVALLLAATALIAGCGANDEAATDLTPAALEGRDVMRSKGCAACHGSNGGGGVGPTFAGLYRSEVQLQGGETVIADGDYLVESIVDPGAKLVEGYSLPMPRTELTQAEIDAVITYIQALADVAP